MTRIRWLRTTTLNLMVLLIVQLSVAAAYKAHLRKASIKDKVPERYIVVLNDDVDVDGFISSFADRIDWNSSEGTIQHMYRHTLKGFSAQLSQASVQKLLASEMVKYIEEDQVGYTQQPTPLWSLSRLDQRDLPVDEQQLDYLGDGASVHLYIVDTGVQYSHVEFAGRTGKGADLIGDPPEIGVDCFGHGTHVAATAAGSTYGVAKNATVHSVRIIGCVDGYTNAVFIAAMEWIAENAIRPAVASMSVGLSFSQAQNAAVQRVINSVGIPVVTSAGNNNKDSCERSPASAPDAITVGAIDMDDNKSTFSNFGRCVDIFAPGTDILSAFLENATETLSGTSMACPHVSGAAAILLGIDGSLKPYEVKGQLLRGATTNKVNNPRFLSPNRLLYIGKDTCMLRCGFAVDVSRNCQCDSQCTDRGDCCTDYQNLCWENDPTCDDRCGYMSDDTMYPYQCDTGCILRQDCCQDYVLFCKPELLCDGIYRQSGTYYSQYYPNDYLNNQLCHNLIISDEYVDYNGVPVLIFDGFSLEVSDNCTSDSLSIYDGNDESSPLIGIYCGQDIPMYVAGSGQNVSVIFETNGSGADMGYAFALKFREVSTYSITSPGIITSNNYPSPYKDNEVTFTTITAPPGQQLLLNFTVFEAEENPEKLLGYNCFDFLLVFDAEYAKRDAYLGEACGSVAMFSPLKSTGQHLHLIFHSDISYALQGYEAMVTFVNRCYSALTSPSVLSSYNYPINYYNNERCYTKIKANYRQQVRVTFIDFDLEEASEIGECKDKLQAYNRDDADPGRLIGEFCGSEIPPPLRSYGRNMMLVFSSDFMGTGRGYKGDVAFVGAITARLVGGRLSNEGRVEITHYKYGTGTICADSMWDIKDASNVCRMLGYGAAKEALGRAAFGQGEGRILLSGLDCTGTETNVDECGHRGWRQRSCRSHRRDAGAVCYDKGNTPLPLRLAGGTNPHIGRVEVRIGQEWGTVCSDRWSMDDAQVVCRSFGYTGAVKALSAAVGGQIGPGNASSPIYFDNMDCDGDEIGLEYCRHNGVGNHNCDHAQDAGVECILPEV